MRYLSIIVFALIISCNSQKKAVMKDINNMNQGNEKLIMLLQDNYSGSDIEETLIIKDAKALKSFYSIINRTRKPGLSVPEVDFTKEMILIHCIGEQNNGKQAALSIVEENDQEVVIKTSIQKPQKKGRSSAITSPFCIYKMPLTQKKISFKKNE